MPRGGGVAVCLSFLCLSSAAKRSSRRRGAAPASGPPSALRCRLERAAARGSRQRVLLQLAVRARRGGNVEGSAVPLGPRRPRLGGGEPRHQSKPEQRLRSSEAEIFVLASITSAAIIILKSGEASTRIVTVCGLQFWACSLNRFLAG